mmetsp:Transcript_10651/g.10755  ORF Transcript_10651/g.10755 Transcript_10651/m.10755 type:complete len:85 (+) Transcript_10651:27-281(+)
MNVKVDLKKDLFLQSSGIFLEVYGGFLTKIVYRFQELGNNDVLQLVSQRDEGGRTPLDIACLLGYKNIVLYLMTNMGAPSDVIH